METILFSVKNTLLKAAMHLGGEDGSSVEIRLRQNTNAEMTMLSCARSSVVVKFFRTVRHRWLGQLCRASFNHAAFPRRLVFDNVSPGTPSKG
ncbi:hypothetical protein [Comamonas aquatica]|uniref:hypothetical protein n=1 Tax=Comamonas aquatica TaxID=225991 RepID=UPI0021B0F63F|nr:hypothetical protein [Comamonas aquatica]